MQSKLRVLVLGTVLAVTSLALQALPHANAAATDTYAYMAYAGGTQVTAVGTTISSDLTAESAILGKLPATDTNEVASVDIAGLVEIGAVTTDVAAQSSGAGFKTTSHARTADVSLLGGLIKVSAVDTTSIAESNGTATPTATSTTELLGLTIGGKKYPANMRPNSGIVIPGVASIVVNASQTAVKDDSVATQGAGLYVTLLKPRNGVAAGAEILLNPTYTLIQPVTRSSGGAELGGGGYGAYAFAHVGDKIKAKTGRLGAKPMPSLGTNGMTLTNTTARVNVPQILKVEGIESTVTGTSIAALSESKVTSKLAGLRLFPSLTGALISATAIGSTSHVRLDGGTPVTEGDLQFINLRIAGKQIPINVGKNTTINVAGLGKVILNEHREVRLGGVAHGYQVTALRVVLSTARAGLPVGAEIEVGVSRAVVWR